MTTFITLLKNTRPLQIIYHIGLLCVGMGIAIIYVGDTQIPSIASFVLVVLSVITAWISTVFFNDVADYAIDMISNPQRPLPQKIITKNHSLVLGWVFLFISLVLAIMLSWQIFITLALYHLLSWIYSMPPLRLKRFPLVATFVAALASLTIIFVGIAILVPNASPRLFPMPIALTLLIGYTLCLPLKDFRDIDGDKADDIKTIPVLFGIQKARAILAGNLFISFVLSAFLLDIRLLFPALVAGIVSIVLLTKKRGRDFLFPTPTLLPLVFVLTTLYGIILVWILWASSG